MISKKRARNTNNIAVQHGEGKAIPCHAIFIKGEADMKVSEALSRADELRPNEFSDELMIAWLKALDAEILEMMDKEYSDSVYDDDEELAMPAPYDMFYVSYLCARIDEANEESDLFADDMAVYNAERQDACAWWWRNHKPRKPKYVRGL